MTLGTGKALQGKVFWAVILSTRNQLSSLQMLRLVGILSAVMDASLTTMRRLQSPGPSRSLADQFLGPGSPVSASITFDFLAAAIIGIGFWWLCRERAMLSLPRWALSFLLLETFTSWLSNPCNSYMTSIQAGFLLSFRGGVL